MFGGSALKSWRLMTKDFRGAYVDGWARAIAAHSSGPITGTLPNQMRRDLIEHPHQVTPSPDIWHSLRDYLRGAIREGVPWINDSTGWLPVPRPDSVDREAAILVHMPPGPSRTQIVQATALILELTADGWRVAGFDDPGSHPAPL
jgi:hypothetical protein